METGRTSAKLDRENIWGQALRKSRFTRVYPHSPCYPLPPLSRKNPKVMVDSPTFLRAKHTTRVLRASLAIHPPQLWGVVSMVGSSPHILPNFTRLVSKKRVHYRNRIMNTPQPTIKAKKDLKIGYRNASDALINTEHRTL